MSNQVLARKFRPKNFAEMVGQQHVVTALTNAISQNRLHHCYAFVGTRGVGKTTLARLFAKSLSCAESITITPCNKCDNCQQINNGCFIDIFEIDAASHTKGDETKEIITKAQ